MRDLLPFIIIGVTTGSLYALAGLGLVLTYRTSGLFNFGHGAIAAAGAYLYYDLYVIRGWPWPVALVVALLVCGPLFGLVLERVARILAGKHVAANIVYTIGLSILVLGLLTEHFGGASRPFPDVLKEQVVPGGFRLSGVLVSWSQVVTVGLSITGAIGLYALLRFTRMGVAMRAVVDNADLLGLTGTSPTRVLTGSWMLGSTFAALSGILLAPRLGLDATLLVLLVVYSFGAVAVGRFTSLPLTFVGGLVIGILESLSTKQFTVPPLNGLPSVIPFVALVVALMVTPTHRLPRHVGRTTAVVRERRGTTSTRRRHLTAVAGVLILLAIPSVIGTRLSVYSSALAFTMLFLSLALLVRVSGQISLCQASFFAVGATTFSHLVHDAGLPWLLAVLGAAITTVPLGALLALPAIRLSGVYLALVTFGFGLLTQNVLFRTFLMWGEHQTLPGARPEFFFIDGSEDKALYYVLLAIVLPAVALVELLTRSRLGRLLRGMADSPMSLTASGLGVNVTKLLVFCLSAFLAGLGGAMYLTQTTAAGPEGFGTFQSLSWLALVVVFAGTGSITLTAFLAAGALAVAPAYQSGLTAEWQLILFGAGSILAVVASGVDWRAWLLGRIQDTTSRNPLRTRASWADPETARPHPALAQQ